MRTLAVLTFLALLAFTAAPARAVPSTIADALARAVAEENLPGAVAAVGAGADLNRYAAGVADVDTRAGFAPNTQVRVASITKTFVAATIMQLVAEGRIDLDAPIETYLPGRVRGAGIDASAITVRQLLRHQSGLPEYFDADTPIPSNNLTMGQASATASAWPASTSPAA